MLKQVLGSFIAALTGWVGGVISATLLLGVYGAYAAGRVRTDIFVAVPWLFLFYIGAFVVPVWLLALIPLYVLVPRSSALWRPYVCTALGVIAGLLIVAVVFPLPSPNTAKEIWVPYTLGAIVGGITCFTGAVTVDRFKLGSPNI